MTSEISEAPYQSEQSHHSEQPEQSQQPDRLANLPLLFDRLHLETFSAATRKQIAAIDACLPQTQCGLCDHADGCLPYAVAIVVEHEAHNKCVPGGQPVSDAIASLLQRPSLPARASQWPINAHTQRPIEVRAVIREQDCIGCTKCIPACPVDAIVGTSKHMHTIFTDLCTGCELCLPPCPVDCIDLVPLDAVQRLGQDPVQMDPVQIDQEQLLTQQQAHLRQRYHTHLNRFAAQLLDNTHAKPVTSMVEAKLGNAAHQRLDISETQAKTTIEAAKLRTKIKKLDKQLSVHSTPKKQAELVRLQQQLAQLWL